MELELELEISSDDFSDSEDNIFPKLKQTANIVKWVLRVYNKTRNIIDNVL